MNPSKIVTPNRLRQAAAAIDLPVIDISSFIGGGKPDFNEAKRIVEGLHQYGALAIRDPRVDESGNTEFLNMMEKYFESRSKIFYAGQPLADAHPEFGYQVGVTPEKKEIAREHSQTIEKFFKNDPVRFEFLKSFFAHLRMSLFEDKITLFSECLLRL